MNTCNLTDQAKSRINKLCNDESIFAVCLNLKRSGCAGLEYKWSSVSDPSSIEQNDLVMSTGTGKFVIGADSLKFLQGAEIDYVSSMVGSQFEIKNPNATSECGCGVSVHFDQDERDSTASTDLAYQINNGVK